KRAKTAAATTARSLVRLQEQLDAQKSQLVQDRAAVQAREKAVRAAEVAVAKRELAAERAVEKLKNEERRRDRAQKAEQDAHIREPRTPTVFREQSVEKLKPKTGEILTQAQSRMILMMVFHLQNKGIGQVEAINQVSNTLKMSERDVSCVYLDWCSRGELYSGEVYASTGTEKGNVIDHQ
ncbi:unnamed protein product, partial [Ascophyllum nodosum]